jgi:hypothetical protein
LTSGLVAVGPDAGSEPLVKVFAIPSHQLQFQFLAAPPAFRGGVRVAVADIDGDGVPDVIAALGPGGGNRVEVINGRSGLPLAGVLGGFQAFSPAESNGAWVAAGDLSGTGRNDIIVGTDVGGAGLVRVFSGRDGHLLRTLSLGAEARQGGVRVAAADVSGQGHADLIVGNGPGPQARVCVYDGLTWKEFENYFAFDPTYRGGVQLAAGDLAGNGQTELVVSADAGTGAVRIFRGSDTAAQAQLPLPSAAFVHGARVAVVPTGSRPQQLAVASGPGAGELDLLNGLTFTSQAQLRPYGPAFDAGLFVAAAGPGPTGPQDPLGTVTIQASPTDLVEGSTTQAVFTVTRTGDISQPRTFVVGLSGTATLGTDYTCSAGTSTTVYVGMAAGQSTGSFSITTVNDGKFDGPETVVASILPYPTDYTTGNPGVATVRIADNAGPPSFIPEPACGCSGNCDLTGQADGLSTGFFESSPEGLRFGDGLGVLRSTDLSSGGFGQGWGLMRTWTNGQGYANKVFGGNNTVDCQLPYLQQDSAGTIVAVASGQTARYFDSVGGSYQPRHFLTEALSYNSAAGEFTLSDSAGNLQVFYDFNAALPASQRGQLKRFVDPAGNVTSLSWTTGGQPQEVTRSVTVGTTTTTESYLYAYLSSGPNAGRLQTVTLRRQINGGAWSSVRVAVYNYYDGTTSLGTLGDLKTEVLQDSAGNVLDTHYYRYYTSSSSTGYPGALKYAFGAVSYGRLLAAFPNPDSATDAHVAPFADLYQEYDSVQRVSKQVVQGAGCSTCTGRLGSFTMSYTTSPFAPGYNSWMTRTLVTLPDNNQRIEYTNFAGEVMLDVFQDTTLNVSWASFYEYDGSGRLILTAQPSAVSGYDDTRPDLLNNVSGNYRPVITPHTAYPDLRRCLPTLLEKGGVALTKRYLRICSCNWNLGLYTGLKELADKLGLKVCACFGAGWDWTAGGRGTPPADQRYCTCKGIWVCADPARWGP